MKSWINKIKRSVTRILKYSDGTRTNEVQFTYDDIVGIQTLQTRLHLIQTHRFIDHIVQRDQRWSESPTASDLSFILGTIFNASWGSIDHSKYNFEWFTAVHQFATVANDRLLTWVSHQSIKPREVAFDTWVDDATAFIHQSIDAREVLILDALRAINWSVEDASEREQKDSLFYIGGKLRDPKACLGSNPLI
jgi:hypothetical protein|tara:strand:- start:3649 stop:4227 length:579 start_codon:yes stop_codon:yes gene_type:complete